MPWPVNRNAADGATEGDDMTLDKRIRRMEVQHGASSERALAVIVQLGETEKDAIARALEKNFHGCTALIVVPAKRANVPDP